LGFLDAAGQQQRQMFHVQPRAGDTGRVSSEAFFSAGSVPTFGHVGMYDQGACHKAASSTGLATPVSQSVYGALVGSLGVAREMMYSHAREVEVYGPAFARGAGPVAAVIGIIVVAIALFCLATGATISILCMDQGNGLSSDICDAGHWL